MLRTLTAHVARTRAQAERAAQEARAPRASGTATGGAASWERICVVGYPKAFLRLLSPVAPPRSVVVLEEPDLLRKRFSGRLHEPPSVAEVHEAAYIGCDEHLEVAERLHAAQPFEAVVTVLEYGVVATALLAERLGLPGAGAHAARTLCDKRALRQASAAAGIRNPVSTEVRSLSDVRRFVHEHGSAGVVLKPANRQASVGVHVLDARRAADGEELGGAWRGLLAATDAAHLPDRPVPVAYLAEERLVGREMSVEALVDDGLVCWVNHTEKSVTPGLHPVERGHVVPARISADDATALTAATSLLVAAIGFGTGVLHAEWMLTDDGPALIECAGRLPGDRIVELIDVAWDMNLCAAYVALLTGRRPTLPTGPTGGAAVAFLGNAMRPGRLRAVEGVDAARRLPEVLDVQVSVAPGDTVGPWTSSWDRAGNVLARGESADAAADRAAVAAALVRFHMTGDGDVAGGQPREHP